MTTEARREELRKRREELSNRRGVIEIYKNVGFNIIIVKNVRTHCIFIYGEK